MSLEYTPLDAELHAYLIEHGARQDETLRHVQAEADAMGDLRVMQIAPDQGALLTLLVAALGAGEALEIGTFTGYSSICIARGLRPGGRLVCCELSEEFAATAARNLEAAGVGDRVEILIGPALDSLRALPEREAFDFAFIDADKPNYGAYFEQALARLRPGGLIALDNVLMRGRVLSPAADDEGAIAVAELNRRIRDDERVDLAMIGVADGITLVRKR